jgi:hypothetical protein
MVDSGPTSDRRTAPPGRALHSAASERGAHWAARLLVLAVVTGLLAVVQVTSAPLAHAGGAGAEIGMPFEGWWDRFGLAHPSAHGPAGNSYADWAIDLYAAAGTAVRPRMRGPAVALKVASVGATCGTAGRTVAIDVHTNGQHVGTVRYGHLSSVGVAANQWISTDTVIGHLSQYSYQTGCWEVSGSTGVHTHFTSFNLTNYSCYYDLGSRSFQAEGTSIGIVGGAFATAAKSQCSGTPQPPTPTDRDGDGTPDSGDHCPDAPGPAATSGCPDGDGDGVADSSDECGAEPGEAAEQGCASETGEPVDVNGDGRRDAIHRWSEGVNTWFSNGDGTWNVTGFQAHAGYGYRQGTWLTADVNGDGRTDVVHRWDGGVNAWLSNGDGSWNVKGQGGDGYGFNDGVWRVADVNGDNRTDLIHRWSEGVNTWFSNGDGTWNVTGFQAHAGYGYANGLFLGSTCCSATLAMAAYVPSGPARVLDSRPGAATIDGQAAGGGLLTGGSTSELVLGGRAGVPQNAAAAVLNVTVTGPSGPGFVTVFPCGASRPLASNLNFTAGQTIPNAVVAKLGAAGKVCLYTDTTTHLIVDVNGYYPGSAAYVPSGPARVLDSRPGAATIDGQAAGGGLLTGGSTSELVLGGRAGVPQNAAAAVLNVTVTGPSGPGFVTVFPCGASRPLASNLNFTAGQTIPNAVVAKLGAAGKVCLYTDTTTHLIVDVNGYYPA